MSKRGADVTIKEARKQANLTQRRVFELYGIPIRTLQDWEAGKRTPPKWLEKMVIESLLKNKGDTMT